MSYPPIHHSPQQSPTPEDLISSTWHILNQSPPPSLREILGAYNQKGNGDREMLLAMLNAKSSEDQRLAALVQLHQTLLQSQAGSKYISPPSPQLNSHSSSSRSSSSLSPRSLRNNNSNNDDHDHPRSSLTLPPIHAHLADIDRSQPNQKRRRRTNPLSPAPSRLSHQSPDSSSPSPIDDSSHPFPNLPPGDPSSPSFSPRSSSHHISNVRDSGT